jgi:hypothetical protein
VTIIIRRPWTQQPQSQVAVASKYTNGLELFVNAGAGAFNGYGKSGTGVMTGTALPAAGLVGRGFLSSAAGVNDQRFQVTSKGSTDPWSVMCAFSLDTTAQGGVFSIGPNNTGSDPHIGLYAYATEVWWMRGGGGDFSVLTRDVNKLYVVFARFDGTTTFVYCNGLFVNQVNGIQYNASTNFYIGSSFGASAKAKHYMAAYWNRDIGAAVASRISRDPLLMLAPRQIIIPSAAAAAGTYTLSNPTMYQLTSTTGYPRVDVTVT